MTESVDDIRYLSPVCGRLRRRHPAAESCYLSLYHHGNHQAPDRRAAVDSGKNLTWPAVPEKATQG